MVIYLTFSTTNTSTQWTTTSNIHIFLVQMISKCLLMFEPQVLQQRNSPRAVRVIKPLLALSYVCRSRGKSGAPGGLCRSQLCISDIDVLRCCADSHRRLRSVGRIHATPPNRNGSSEHARCIYTLKGKNWNSQCTSVATWNSNLRPYRALFTSLTTSLPLPTSVLSEILFFRLYETFLCISPLWNPLKLTLLQHRSFN